jgi:electron transport complex protein RnfB
MWRKTKIGVMNMSALLVVGIIGAILGLGLSIASDKFHVEIDERIEKVTEMLPGYNCGACGYPGCAGLAEGSVNEGVKLGLCKPAKKDVLEEIVNYLKETPGPDGNTVDAKI